MRAYKLAEIRREQSLTQRSYGEALGGHLRVVADFGDAEYTVP
ncbi:hypothetical protein GCM10023347_09700 [Streptomyces chumphonensis]